MTYKEILQTIIAVLGSIINFLVGDISVLFITTIIFMCIDYITGIIKCFSPHNDIKLSSEIGIWGFIKKFLYIVIIAMGYRIDIVMETDIVKNACCWFFLANETISIIENLGQSGVPIPNAISNVLAVLKNKAGIDEDKNND